MATGMERRIGRVIGIVGILGVVVAGGCAGNGNATRDNELLLLENSELRQQIAMFENELATCRQENANLQADYDTLVTTETATPANSNTGFEDIEGVGTRRTESGEVVVAIAGDVLFDSGSTNLRSEATTSLDRVAEVLHSRYGTQPVRVEGYTDTDPIRKSKWETNERLSAERALAVENYLVSRGVNNNRIYSAAFGPARPKSSKQASRRVEIVILAAQS